MPLRPQLLAEIQQAIGPALVPSLTSSSAAHDLYEAYLFALVVQAARAEGADVEYRCIDGGVPNPFIFRTSPGYINSNEHNYGYAKLEFPNRTPLEAHVGIRVSGHSHVLHECDIAVLLKDEADLCRTRGPERVAPRSSKIVIAIEAKHYTTAIPLHLGRGFLGLDRDFSADKLFFVINRDAETVEKLLAHKKRLWEHNINPAEPECVNRLRYAFQTAFKDYKARFAP